jgi:hypothetical protein
MRRGWRFDSERHSLSRRGIKTGQSKLMRYGLPSHKDFFKQKMLYSVAVQVVSSKEYDSLPEERRLESKGEMSYAMTVLNPDDSREKIIIRDSGIEKLNKKLLQHELEEYNIYRKLLDNGYPSTKAGDLAHELTFTKVKNSEVDRAYGNIGDPVM